MKLAVDLYLSGDGTLHVGLRWRWYPTLEGGGKLRPLRPSAPARDLPAGVHASADGTLHVSPDWRWYPTKAGGGKLRPRAAPGRPTGRAAAARGAI
jgi:hypothetical protein